MRIQKNIRPGRLPPAISALVLVAVQLPAWADADLGEGIALEPKRMEAGIGLVGQYLGDYRGSKRYQLKALPIPYFIYFGRFIKADGRGVRGDFIANDRLEINLSFDGALSGDSDGNELRAGMPRLANNFEFGPALNINLTGASFRTGWSLELPLRAVVAVDIERIDLRHVGFLSSPRLTWRQPDFYAGWRMTAGFGAVWASEDYHAYFYEVEPAYATAWRPQYAASAGYSGVYAGVAAFKQVGDWRLAMSFRYDNLASAAFADSPLVETEHFYSLSFGLIRTFWSRS